MTVDISNDRTRILPVDFGEGALGKWVARSFKYSDFAGSGDTLDLIDIPANSFIAEMYYVPKTVFNGTTPIVTIGDESDEVEYLTTNELTETDAALVSDMKSPDATGTYTLVGARPFYASANHLRAKFTFSGTPTTGEGTVIACIVTVPSY